MATRVHIPTTDELADLLATVLAGVAGGGKPRWRKVIGPVEHLPAWSNVRCNWRLKPRGSDEDRAMVEQAAAIVRDAHPYAMGPGQRALTRPATATAGLPQAASR